MDFYVGNCTQQVQDFIYRIPETLSPRTQRIPIGGQVRISGDLSAKDIDAIVAQHAPYGLVAVDEIDRTRPFIGICYSEGKPISVGKLTDAMYHNEQVLTERGREIRKESAVALNNAIEEQTGGVKKLEMSIMEEGRDPRDESPVISEGVRVEREEGQPPARNKGGRPRKAR